MAELISSKEVLDLELLSKIVVKLMKKDIFERFIKTGELPEEDQEFCESIDWYPIDELEVREEYAEKLKSRLKEPVGKPLTIEEFNKS